MVKTSLMGAFGWSPWACDGLEDRGFLELEADDQAEDHQQGGGEEGYAPAPGEEGFGAEGSGKDGQDTVGHEVAGGRADLGRGGPEAALVGVAELAGQQHSAAPFAADADALGQAQEHQDDGGPDADDRVVRQRTDEDGCDADQHQGEHEDVLAAHLVAQAAEHDAADGAGEVAHREGREGQQEPHELIVGGEEDLGEDEGRGHRVDGEVVVLKRGAGEAGDVRLEGAGAAASLPPFWLLCWCWSWVSSGGEAACRGCRVDAAVGTGGAKLARRTSRC